MRHQNVGYIKDVDQLIEETPLDSVLAHYGLPPPDPHASEHRMNCVFDESCRDRQYGNLTVSLASAKRIYCHTCRTRGNLLTLIHGLEQQRPPAGGRLRGDEFKQAVAQLRDINGQPTKTAPPQPAPQPEAPERRINLPLARHEKPAARELADLHRDLLTDVSVISPDAARYLRTREWLTSELMQKWQVGWIPGNGRSLFRKQYFVYTHHNEAGQVITYSGRDLAFERKQTRWEREGRPEGSRPAKHRYVKGYLRGLELYGSHQQRMREPHVVESLKRFGVVVVEGMNDVIRLDALGVAAVGLCSNRATPEQINKIERFARSLTGDRVLLLPDLDDEGETGFKDLLWTLAAKRLDVRLAWSRESEQIEVAPGKQPEDLSEDEWETLAAVL